MNDDFERPEIDLSNLIMCPEMDKNIVDLLMIRNDDIISMYAAKLIKRYQAARCKTCKYHNEYGDCECPKFEDSLPYNFQEMGIDIADMLILSQGPADFFTGDKFGCIHHAEKEKEKSC